MDTKRFWEIIDTARASACGWDDMYDPLIDLLSSLCISDIMKWNNIFSEYHRLAYKNKLWAAAYVINGGCSDDGFEDFRGWLIAQGKDVYLNALSNPVSLAHREGCKGGSVAFEEMLTAASHSIFKKLSIHSAHELFEQELIKCPLTDGERAEIAAEIVYADDMDGEWDENDANGFHELLPNLCEVFDW
jgi:hypothetical protein